MSTGFQYIIDKAATISINKRAVVAQSVSRDQTTRAVSRGGQVWRFDVAAPAGLVWAEARPNLEIIDSLDRFTPVQIQFSNTGYAWLLRYQGTATTTGGWTATWTKGSNQIFVSPQGFSGGNLLVAGDVIQLAGGRVYTVAQTTTTGYVTLNRPVQEATGSGAVVIGPAVTWTVLCNAIPTWTIFNTNLVNFNGPFQFTESFA